MASVLPPLAAGWTSAGLRLASGRLPSAEATLVPGVALVLPVLLFAAGLGSLNRILYPAAALAAACFLYSRRSPWLVGLCIWLFCATPLVRRLTDLQAGWDPANPLQIAPYLPGLVAASSLLPYALRRQPRFVTPFVIMLCCVLYGFALAAYDGRLVSGTVDLLRWAIGPVMIVHMLRQAELQAGFRRVALGSLLLACALMAVYAIAQFIAPLAWDREWMVNVASLGLDSIGQPRPFEVRVFGTMNSPASLSGMLVVGIVLAFSRRIVVALPLQLLMVVALGLTQYRAGWGGLAVALGFLALGGSLGQRLRLAVMAAGLVLMAGLLTQPPELYRTISARLETLATLSSDRSGEERLVEYARFFSETENLVVGEGLAIAGATRRLDGRPGAFIDAGLTEPFQAFGVFGGAAFLGAVAAAFLGTWARPAPGGERFMSLYRAAALGTLAQLPFGRVLMGETGFGMWLCIGLALAAILAERQARQHELWRRMTPKTAETIWR